MIYFLTASKDSSIYSISPRKNVGLDQILEVYNIHGGSGWLNAGTGVARSLIQFDLTSISQLVSSSQITIGDARLVLRETNNSNVPVEQYKLLFNPISGSWSNGNGYFYETIDSIGVAWNFRSIETGTHWNSGSYSVNVTGSYSNGNGGVWWNNYTASQAYSYESSDIDVSIKDIFSAWLSGSIENNGLLMRLDPQIEFSDTNINIKLYSRETNTIYQPKLYVEWDDSSFVTGSLLPLDLDTIKLSVTNIQSTYKVNNIYKFKVVGTELYNLKTFTPTLQTSIKYLPRDTFYQIRDLLSDVIIIPYSNYTRVSCDSTGNFFKLNLNNWEPRKYKIEFKIKNGDETYHYTPTNNIFEITL